MQKIIKNAIQCNLCGDIIESTYRHDFVTCKCGCCSVDGGLDYLRRGFTHSEERWKQIKQFLKINDIIQNADVCQLCGVSAATANRILAKFTAEGKLAKCRKGGHWVYQRTSQV